MNARSLTLWTLWSIITGVVWSSDPSPAHEPGKKPAPTHTQQQLLPVVTEDNNPWSGRDDNNRHK